MRLFLQHEAVFYVQEKRLFLHYKTVFYVQEKKGSSYTTKLSFMRKQKCLFSHYKIVFSASQSARSNAVGYSMRHAHKFVGICHSLISQ
jgi:hypothetical protein